MIKKNLCLECGQLMDPSRERTYTSSFCSHSLCALCYAQLEVQRNAPHPIKCVSCQTEVPRNAPKAFSEDTSRLELTKIEINGAEITSLVQECISHPGQKCEFLYKAKNDLLNGLQCGNCLKEFDQKYSEAGVFDIKNLTGIFMLAPNPQSHLKFVETFSRKAQKLFGEKTLKFAETVRKASLILEKVEGSRFLEGLYPFIRHPEAYCVQFCEDGESLHIRPKIDGFSQAAVETSAFLEGFSIVIERLLSFNPLCFDRKTEKTILEEIASFLDSLWIRIQNQICPVSLIPQKFSQETVDETLKNKKSYSVSQPIRIIHRPSPTKNRYLASIGMPIDSPQQVGSFQNRYVPDRSYHCTPFTESDRLENNENIQNSPNFNRISAFNRETPYTGRVRANIRSEVEYKTETSNKVFSANTKLAEKSYFFAMPLMANVDNVFVAESSKKKEFDDIRNRLQLLTQRICGDSISSPSDFVEAIRISQSMQLEFYRLKKTTFPGFVEFRVANMGCEDTLQLTERIREYELKRPLVYRKGEARQSELADPEFRKLNNQKGHRRVTVTRHLETIRVTRSELLPTTSQVCVFLEKEVTGECLFEIRVEGQWGGGCFFGLATEKTKKFVQRVNSGSWLGGKGGFYFQNNHAKLELGGGSDYCLQLNVQCLIGPGDIAWLAARKDSGIKLVVPKATQTINYVSPLSEEKVYLFFCLEKTSQGFEVRKLIPPPSQGKPRKRGLLGQLDWKHSVGEERNL